MANPAPTINQINAFNATQGTTIDFNIIGGTELVRSNRIYIYDLSDNSLICTHLYVSTESIHELPPNTDGSIVYESGKSSADFVNGAQYYAQIQTFTDIGGTEGGSGLSVAKMFWCLVDPSLTISTIPSSISTTSYNVSATYNANTSVVSNIIQQYQFSLYSATGSLLQSSGVVVGSGTQQGTSTAYDISYNFTGLSVGSSYYVTVEVTTTQGMNVNTQSNTFTISIDTPTLGEATVVNNACDGYISVTSNLSSEYGGSGSGEIVSFETDSENVFTKLQVNLEPIQDLHGYDAPWVGGAGKNKLPNIATSGTVANVTYTVNSDGTIIANGTSNSWNALTIGTVTLPSGTYWLTSGITSSDNYLEFVLNGSNVDTNSLSRRQFTLTQSTEITVKLYARPNKTATNLKLYPMIYLDSETDTTYSPYSNICPISGHDEVEVDVVGKNLLDKDNITWTNAIRGDDGTPTASTSSHYTNAIYGVKANAEYTISGMLNTSTSSYRLYFLKKDGTWISRTSTHSGTPYTFTTPNECEAIQIQVAVTSTITFDDVQLELGTTATDYEPYQGQSYHQEIEATYTPTVQENEPYQFKCTGDVGGDRESIELVGGSVAWNQLVLDENRNFTSTTSDTRPFTLQLRMFASPYTTAFVSNLGLGKGVYTRLFVGIDTQGSGLYLTHNGSNNNIEIWRNYNQQLEVGHKYLFSVNVVNNDTTTVGGLVLEDMMLIDLTQMFGSTIADYVYSLEQATAGSGIAWFKSYGFFTKPYYEYDTGTFKSVNPTAHKMVGFNQLPYIPTYKDNTGIRDFQFSGDCVRLIEGKQYEFNFENISNATNWRIAYISFDLNGFRLSHNVFTNVTTSTSSSFSWYDYQKAFLEGGNGTTKWVRFTAKEDCYIYFTFGVGNASSSSIMSKPCLHWGGERNGEYEPYVEHSYPLDSSLTLRGIPKLDASNKLYYDGDTYESDGTVTRKYGIVDLGSLTWRLGSTSGGGAPRMVAILSDIKNTNGNGNIYPNIICTKYLVSTPNLTYNRNEGITTNVGSHEIIVFDANYSDKDAFKTAMNGVYAIYELATPTTETAEPFEEIQKVTPNYGTEEFVTDSIVPVGNNTQYYTRDIYGGTLDLVSGVLTVTHECGEFSGSETWSYYNGATPFFYAYKNELIGKMGSVSDVVCSNGIIVGVNNVNINGQIRVYLYANPSLTSDTNMNAIMANGINFVYPLATPTTYQLTPQQIQTLLGTNNVWSEQGEISLAYHIPITNLLVKRQDVGDVSGDWLTLYSQPITQASDMDFTFIDFTNQYGKTYKYALVPLLTQTQSGVEVEVEGGYTVSDEVQSIFDGVFIVDSTGSQKCKANVGYGNVDMNQTVGAITPIGAKYPVVITNSKNQYHNGSISGTIVPDDYYFNGNLSRIDMVNKRDELEQFLTNKRAKIIKDWNGKIWLVMIMDNVSCTFNNNYGMGIVNFSTNWVEVGDPTNQQDLQATGLINVGGV